MPLKLVQNLLTEAGFDEMGQGAEIWVKESDHRIANNLQFVGGLLRLQASNLRRRQLASSPEEILAALDEAGRRIETVGRLHRLLAQRRDTEAVDVTRFLREIAEATVSSLGQADRAHLSFSSSQTCEVPARQALPMGLIVGELVTNSVKYAHPTGVVGEISVVCGRNREGGIDIQVSDDGVGFPEGFEPERAESLGLRLVYTFSQQLDARLAFLQSDIGLTVRISTPP
jgi:two-component sensor histidine kinase